MLNERQDTIGGWVALAIFFGILVVGLILMSCAGIPFFGDYMGPPESLAEHNRHNLISAVFLTLPGFCVAGYGLWRLIRIGKLK